LKPGWKNKESAKAMHISEGILSGPILISGAAIAAGGTAIGLTQLDYDRIVQAGILSAAFFVASMVHVPIGPTNAHLILNGIIGLLLGWAAFPIILTALLLQAILFQFGGITTLGINCLIMALPAVMVHYFFRGLIFKSKAICRLSAFLSGFLAVLLGVILLAAALIFAEENFFETAFLTALIHSPIMVIEGIINIFCIDFLKKVHPVLLPGFDYQETAVFK
jgi:cobalt/nickel transport system permease protein